MAPLVNSSPPHPTKSTVRGIAGILGYLVLVVLPAGIALAVTTPASTSILTEAGKMAALTGMSALMLQFILAGRLRFLTAPYGLDMILGLHRSRSARLGRVAVPSFISI